MWAWATAMAENGLDVRVLCDDKRAASSSRGIHVRSIPHVGHGRLRIPRDIASEVESDDVVVLHSAWVAHNLYAARSLRSRGRSYIVVPHGGYDPNVISTRPLLRRLWGTAERRMLEGAAATHVFFESEAPQVRHLAPTGEVVVAPTGHPGEPPYWTGGNGHLVWIGRYDIRHKGLDLLIDAVASLPAAERPTVRLHGRDSANTRADVEALVERRGVAAWVSVAGPIVGPEKRELLRTAAGYVHPSRWECHSIAALEALSSGIPVLISRGAQIASALDRSAAAIVVSPDVGSLAAGLRRMSTPDRSMGKRATLFLEEELAWPQSVASLTTGVLAQVRR